ncbi:MAG: demethylmenaquinone methyltransferase [Firmicutes bacterium]|nr:demethylmenaquinone methyltransferase [Bacillota bacterium]
MGKQEKVYAVFQGISVEYDKMNDIISLGQHRRWKNDLLRQVKEGEPSSIMDLCCGTGDIALSMATAMPDAHVHGVDFSENMLVVARQRLEASGLKHVQFSQGNAMDLQFPDETFDCATISFGLRNVENYEKALSEIFRVLKPGGRLFCLEASYPENKFVRPFFRMYFKYIMPLMGRVFAKSPDEYQWLHDSTEAFLTKDQLRDLFCSIGFGEAGYRSFLLGSAALHWGIKPVSK